MRHYGSTVGCVVSGDRSFPDSATGWCLPGPDEPIPTDIEYFSGEVHTLARLMGMVQATVRSDRPYLMPAETQGLAFFAERLRNENLEMLSAISSIYSAPPTLSGRTITTFHQFAIATGCAWRDWLFRFMSLSELRAGAYAGSHEDRLKLWQSAAVRFGESKEIWPFDEVDIGSLVSGIEFESAKVAEFSKPDLEQYAFIGAPKLAEMFRLTIGTVNKRLERFRNNDPSRRDWIETEDAPKGQPRYLHRLSAVKSILKASE